MRNKFITGTLIAMLLMLVSAAVMASSVIVTGNGPTVDSALRDCMRVAVEQSVGVYIDAKTLVDKNTVLQDSIYANSRGYVRNYKVLKSVQNNDGYTLTAEVDVDTDPDSALMNSLQKLNLINVGLNNPRVAVMVNDGAYSNPVTENVIENILGNEGFRIVSTAITNRDALRSSVITISSSDIMRITKSIPRGSVDYLILGVTNVKNAGDIAGFGMFTGKGSGAFKIIRVDTGDIIASNTFTATALDISGSAAVDEACEMLGKTAAGFVKDKLFSYAANPVKTMQVTVLGVTDLFKAQRIQSVIANFAGITSVQINQFDSNSTVMTVIGSITAMDLATYAGAALPDLALQSVTNSAVCFRVK